jgi:hypothetical protein
MHIRCEFKDDTRKEVIFSITSTNIKEENELNLFWNLLSQKKMIGLSKDLDPNKMTMIRFEYEN